MSKQAQDIPRELDWRRHDLGRTLDELVRRLIEIETRLALLEARR